jgi:hypothetical protein
MRCEYINHLIIVRRFTEPCAEENNYRTPSNCATNINFVEYTWILLPCAIISMYAKLGREEVNSKRSMTVTRRVSDSFLRPVTISGELRRVNEVEIIGDI